MAVSIGKRGEETHSCPPLLLLALERTSRQQDAATLGTSEVPPPTKGWGEEVLRKRVQRECIGKVPPLASPKAVESRVEPRGWLREPLSLQTLESTCSCVNCRFAGDSVGSAHAHQPDC